MKKNNISHHFHYQIIKLFMVSKLRNEAWIESSLKSLVTIEVMMSHLNDDNQITWKGLFTITNHVFLFNKKKFNFNI